MAWLAVDKDGTENIFEDRPYRDEEFWILPSFMYCIIELPKGSIEKLIGKVITWDDEPIEIK